MLAAGACRRTRFALTRCARTAAASQSTKRAARAAPAAALLADPQIAARSPRRPRSEGCGAGRWACRRTRFALARCARTAAASQSTKRAARAAPAAALLAGPQIAARSPRRPRSEGCGAGRWARRRTRFALTRCARTAAASQSMKRAARAAPAAALLADPQIAARSRRRPRSEGCGAGRWARLWRAESRRRCGRARSALRPLTRRVCPNGVRAAHAVSYAAGRPTEQRRGVAARAAPAAALLADPQIACSPRRPRSEGCGAGRWVRLWRAESRRRCGRARSALRPLTRRVCPNGVRAAHAVSYAAGRTTEQRRGVAAQQRPRHRSARRPASQPYTPTPTPTPTRH